ncbi:MAG: UvrD-helicase domain-containing protein [Pseudomonadota bacterium]
MAHQQDLLATLNPAQREAVLHAHGPLLVLAGAGSGKTRVITAKIAHLVRELQVPARHVYAVTFTNKAAREMQERVGKMLSAEERRGLHVSTFHTLGLTILKHEYAAAGLRPGFSILDAEDALAMLRELSKLPDKAQVEDLRNRISLWKNDGLSPLDAMALAGTDDEHDAARLYQAYERQLRASNALDFDDLIALPVRLFGEQAELRAKWRQRVRHLLVDEVQDTNAAQYALLRHLLDVTANLTAVGDDHQSVYAWRGARPENLSLLAQDYPTLKVIKLEQNYRSVNTVLKAANALIRNNSKQFEKNLWSALGEGEPLRAILCKDADDEALRIAVEILQHKFRNRTNFADYAVLYRGNHQARLLEGALRQHAIPYHITGGQSFFERSEIRDLSAYLRLLANPDDDTAFLRVVNTPRREIGPGTLEKLGAYAQGRGASLDAASREFGLSQQLGERPLERLQRFTAWLDGLRQAAEHAPLAALRQLVQDIGYEDWLKDTSDTPKQAERRWKNVNDWLEWLEKLASGEDALDIQELAGRASLMGILERQNESDAGDQVRLMTLHAAKGLEFPHVFIIGMEEELLPHRESLDEEKLEEERRLAYVGITRAQQSLTFTLTRKRKRYGEWVDSEPSRFLEEIPTDLLRWEGRPDESAPEEKKTKGRAQLEGLKALLGGG